MTLVHQTPHATVTVDGVVQDTVLEWHTAHAFGQIATADITIGYPIGDEITEGAVVEIGAAADEADAESRVFWGTITAIERDTSEGGRIVSLRCSGQAWGLTLPLEDDLAFAGGADADAQLLTSQVIHIGDDTVSWYADTGADGLTFDLSFSPAVDARFVRIEGRLHGTNSYQQEPDRDLTNWSRIEIRQAGRRIGYANLPRSAERYADQLAYSDDDNWEDFALTIGARIEAEDGDVTVRLTSGRKPGSSERDEYEVKGITYAIAGRMPARDVIRSVLRDRGYGANGVPYRVAPITDLAGATIQLGGNGLVHNGRIVIPERTPVWDWLVEATDLFGHRVLDGPHGIEVIGARGAPPDQTPAATFTEGVNIFGITPSTDVAEVVTSWSVLGASGTDESGEPFRYESTSDPAGIAMPAYIPNPPGAVSGEVQSDLLVSDSLAQAVREIKEVEYEALPVTAVLGSVPPSPTILPGQVIQVTASALGVDSLLWVTGVRHDWDDGGFWTSIDARAATGEANAEAPVSFAPEEQTSSATRHIGNTEIAWYARSDADGLSVDYPWHPGGDYGGVRITGRYHGANSWRSGSKAETPSTVEVWQLGVMLGSAALPWHSERYSRRQDYDNDAYWADLDVMLAADVVDASADIIFTSGTARDGTRDDYEVKEVEVILYAEATEQGSTTHGGADWFAYQPTRAYRRAS